MAASTLTSKGQTTIPREIREAAGLRTGDRLNFTVLADGTIILRVKNRSIRDLAGKTKSARHVSVEQMNR
jgi:AbrB family looped-hinge helix DNA binding protein